MLLKRSPPEHSFLATTIICPTGDKKGGDDPRPAENEPSRLGAWLSNVPASSSSLSFVWWRVLRRMCMLGQPSGEADDAVPDDGNGQSESATPNAG